ncbi:MAG TPA: hypothetical protein PKC45_08225 [Gemmatales bacterium]|nr:hypothetical protein [Gemmatales bacterium]
MLREELRLLSGSGSEVELVLRSRQPVLQQLPLGLLQAEGEEVTCSTIQTKTKEIDRA